MLFLGVLTVAEKTTDSMLDKISELTAERNELQQRLTQARLEAIRSLARKVHNGAPAPFQEWYDRGVGQWLQMEAELAAPASLNSEVKR